MNDQICNSDEDDPSPCNCESEFFLEGACDVEQESLTWFVVQNSTTGLAEILFTDENLDNLDIQYASSNETYNNDNGNIQLDKLGSSSWEKRIIGIRKIKKRFMSLKYF